MMLQNVIPSYKEHELKIDVAFYDDIINHDKRFEVRKNDRNFQVGDYVRIVPFDHEKKEYIARPVLPFKIVYILKDHPGLQVGYVVLGLEI